VKTTSNLIGGTTIMPWQDPNDPRANSWRDFFDMTFGTYRVVLPVLFILLIGLGILMFLLGLIF